MITITLTSSANHHNKLDIKKSYCKEFYIKGTYLLHVYTHLHKNTNFLWIKRFSKLDRTLHITSDHPLLTWGEWFSISGSR